MHYHQFSSCSKDQAFIVNSVPNAYTSTTSLLSTESEVNDIANLVPTQYIPSYLYPSFQFDPFCLGCCNGVVCMAILSKLLEVAIVFWNPQADFTIFIGEISFGFGYDSDDDFKVVKIVNYLTQNDFFVSEAGVYSANSDTWASIELTFKFRVLGMKGIYHLCNKTTVNGNPYWVVEIVENESVAAGDALIWFDVTRLEFKTVPLLGLKLEDATKVPFVNWKSSLAALLYTKYDKRLECLDVWVFQEGDMVWTNNHTFGPVEMKVGWCLQGSENGIIIMGDRSDGKLFVLDPETRWVKEIEIGKYQTNYMEIHGYNESLVCIDGMKQIQVKKRKRKMQDDPVAELLGIMCCHSKWSD